MVLCRLLVTLLPPQTIENRGDWRILSNRVSQVRHRAAVHRPVARGRIYA